MNERPATSSASLAGATTRNTLVYPAMPRAAVDVDVYRSAARDCVPKWLTANGAAPWLNVCNPACRNHGADPGELLRIVSCAAALGLYGQSTGRPDEASACRDHAHAGVVLWQSRLEADGSPTRRVLRQSPLTAFIASRITQLLLEGDIGDAPLLADDLDKHLSWLSRLPFRPCWIEAATIAALADGAVLLRRTELLRQARRRLNALLLRQSPEGWFPEDGGFDIGLHSLTVDALARAYARHNWKELSHPLVVALRFVRHFVTPDGVTGACTSTFGTGFVSPFGPELLAPTHEDAAALARLIRARYARTGATTSWSPDLAAMLGPSLLLAARHARDRIDDECAEDLPARGITRFDHARLIVAQTPAYRAVVATRAGGALWHWWSKTQTLIEDPGIIAVFPRGVRVSGQFDDRNRERLDEATVICGGMLRRMHRPESARVNLVRAGLRKLQERMRRSPADPPLRRRAKSLSPDQKRTLARDYFRREIEFVEESLRVRDELIARLSCDALVCQSPLTPEAHPLVDRISVEAGVASPIYVRGGHHLLVDRNYRRGRLEGIANRALD